MQPLAHTFSVALANGPVSQAAAVANYLVNVPLGVGDQDQGVGGVAGWCPVWDLILSSGSDS